MVDFLELHMGVYLRAKYEVSSIIVVCFRQGGGYFYLPPLTSKQTPKEDTQNMVNKGVTFDTFSNLKLDCRHSAFVN